MKRLIALLPVALLLAAAPSAQAQGTRTGYVRLEHIFREYYKTKLADAQLREQVEEVKKERDALVKDFEGLQTKFNEARQQAAQIELSQEIRDQKRQEAEKLLAEIREFQQRMQTYDQEKQQAINEQRLRMRNRILGEIQEQIKDHARKSGFAVVIDASARAANGVEIFQYYDTNADITDTMLDLLNKGQAGAP
jgi:outer membrane protein